MTGYDLPLTNAVLNGTAGVLLICGFAAIRMKFVRLHMTLMLTALVVSTTFLASYLYYHLAVRHGESTHYVGEWRPAFLVILLSHIALAAITVPLALTTAILALLGRFHTHKRIARVTLPVWLYVSVTGVVVYLFLKDLYPKQ
jgi:putative membrane protein